MRLSRHNVFRSRFGVPQFCISSVIAIALWCGNVNEVQAQDAAGKGVIETKNPVSVPLETPKRSELFSLGLDYSWLSKTGFRDRNFSAGQLGEQTILGHLKFRIPVTDSLSFSIGGSYEGLFFDVPKSISKRAMPLRSQLERVSVDLGVNYRLSEKLTLFGEVTPFIASDFVDISSDDLGIGGAVGFRYAPHGDDRLFFIVGISASSNSYTPISPVGGVHWEPNDLFTVNLIFPKPEFDLHLTSQITLFANAELYGGSFRVGKNVGTNIGEPRYNNAMLDYQEVRVGGGLRFQLLKNLSLEAEGGSTVYRRFNYFRFGQHTNPKNAPFIEASLKSWF